VGKVKFWNLQAASWVQLKGAKGDSIGRGERQLDVPSRGNAGRAMKYEEGSHKRIGLRFESS